MIVIDGRQVEIDLITFPPEMGGVELPNALKQKLLQNLNWEDFIRLHFRRQNLGFSAQDGFHIGA